jgi:hypothetical protein
VSFDSTALGSGGYKNTTCRKGLGFSGDSSSLGRTGGGDPGGQRTIDGSGAINWNICRKNLLTLA